MAGPQNAAPAKQEDKSLTLKGDLCEFYLGEGTPRRQYFYTHLPFGTIRRYFKVEPYDPARGKGEQRENIPAWSRKLQKAMKAGEFTPASWAGGVRDGHLKNLTVDAKKKTVVLNVFAGNPLAVLDGGHRFGALELLLKDASSEAIRKSIEEIDVPIQIYLNPELIRADFQNLNEGKKVSRSQLKMMKEEKLETDEKKGPGVKVARRTAVLMNKLPDTDSFLHNDINFVGGGGGKTEYSSITGLNGSDLATSIAGGAKIVLYQPFVEKFFATDKEKTYEEKAADFLVDCYKAIWQGINKYDEKEKDHNRIAGTTEEYPELLLDGMMLRPNRLGGKGTKSGTGLLLMVGNMLAFRMLNVVKKLTIKPDHVKHAVAAMREVLLAEVQGGGSGTAKREATGEYIREYFKNDIRSTEDHETDLNLMGAVDGVPTLLCDYILTPSTCNVKKKSERTVKEEPNATLAGPNQTSDDFDDPVGELSEDDETDGDDTEQVDDTDPDYNPGDDDEAPVITGDNEDTDADEGEDTDTEAEDGPPPVVDEVDETPDDDEVEDFVPPPPPPSGRRKKKATAEVGLEG